MDQKSLTEPLMAKGESLPPPVVDDRKPKRPLWRKLARIALTGAVCYLIARAVADPSSETVVSDLDGWAFDVDDRTLLQGSEDFDWHLHPSHEDVACDDLQGPQWTHMTELAETKTWNLSTSAEKIKIFTRGPIVGNLTFTSGNTAGDDIEVDVTLVKPSHLCHQRSIGDDDEGNDEPSPPIPPSPPPQPEVKVCPFVSSDGKVEGLGIIAIRPRRRHDGPPHRCPGDSCHHEPPEPDHPPLHAVHPPSRPSPEHPHGPHGPAPPPPPPPGTPPHRRPPLAFAKVDIRLPASSSFAKSTLALKNFEVAAPKFKFDVGDIKATFESLVIVSTQAPITVKDVSAAVLAVVSPGGNITGSFSVSKRLDIASIGNTIDVKVKLYGASSDRVFNATTLKVNSRFGSINANVALISSSDEPSTYPPSYYIEAVNVKGPTNITYTSQPLNSTVVTSVTGVGGDATIKADPAFQGLFDLQSYGSRPIFIVPEDTKDPWGGNNKRVVSFFKTWGWWNLKGVVYWKAPETVAEHDGPLSRTRIVTKGGQASLYLG